ncbi:hypothetical protein GCM10023165_48630 [Variovorax defluvii]|uniref:Carboxymuconolactone decarboxylase family protein n=1 Tax=Variovorax defluvii TaxID=913761 RepID=A0ABP8ICC9_9BURK
MKHDWIPRLGTDAMPDALAAYLGPRVRRLGYLGEMFQVGAQAPDVLLHFMHFTDALKDAVPFDISEAVVLTVATLMENRYERNQHERLSMRHGLGRDWLAEVRRLSPDSAHLMTPAQQAAQRYAIAAIRTRGRGAGAEFDALDPHFAPGEAMAIAFLVGRYVTHALIVNTLELDPPVPSVFEDGFDPAASPGASQ